MNIQVLLEPVANNGYRARIGEPLALVAEGATREEAAAKLKVHMQDRLSKGAELISIDVSPSQHPLAEFAGMFRDDPYFDDVVRIMEENRRKMNDDPDVP